MSSSWSGIAVYLLKKKKKNLFYQPVADYSRRTGSTFFQRLFEDDKANVMTFFFFFWSANSKWGGVLQVDVSTWSAIIRQLLIRFESDIGEYIIDVYFKTIDPAVDEYFVNYVCSR